ncbi:hypothetical protein K450DRAFT_234810 [Umbelopsis ramanniana AG]|uniref:Uncharacterized protein n=1 Tax=Umbelopsis ramanniana AG TaxID=1314678 RepID=A0AAD5ECU4_UMBRA|nr:uncharacterized protein K450DRAFT_234810 [Umbelopsis ramanniana AG]KAI8580834.1 hypothetical protein K450DRAFT_234810 [Umbelopsis ramanniana AG]
MLQSYPDGRYFEECTSVRPVATDLPRAESTESYEGHTLVYEPENRMSDCFLQRYSTSVFNLEAFE